MRVAGALLALLLCACKSAPDEQRAAPAPSASRPAAETPRELFERLRVLGGFQPDAWVVWSPIWPKRRDEVIVMYDLSAKHAPLSGEKSLTWVLRPAEGKPIERAARREGDFAVVRVPAAELGPGRFWFRSGERRDDNCGNPFGLPIVDLTPVWDLAESDHFVYKWLSDDPVRERVREVLVRLERRRKAVLGETGLKGPAGKITFLHYRDRETGLQHQAQPGNNYDWSRNLVFSSEAEDDVHELTHLYFFREVGRHVGIFDEGVAIHFGQEIAVGAGWRDRPCDAGALDALAAGTLPPLMELLTPARMYAPDWSIVGTAYYPAACSFVGQLVKQFGVPRLLRFLSAYDCTTQHDAARVAREFEKVLGVPLETADRKWRVELTRPPRPPAP